MQTFENKLGLAQELLMNEALLFWGEWTLEVCFHFNGNIFCQPASSK